MILSRPLIVDEKETPALALLYNQHVAEPQIAVEDAPGVHPAHGFGKSPYKGALAAKRAGAGVPANIV